MNTPIWEALGYMGKVAIPQRLSQGQNQGRFPAARPGIIQGGQKGVGPDISPGCSHFELCPQGGNTRARVCWTWRSLFCCFLTKGSRRPVTSSAKENSRT